MAAPPSHPAPAGPTPPAENTRTARTDAPAPPNPPRLLAAPRLLAPPLLLVSGAAVATYSVVRYDLRIVAAYTVLATLLLASLVRSGARARLDHRAGGVVALAAAGAATLAVPAFTYLEPDAASRVRWLLGGAALAAAAISCLPWRRSGDAAFAVAVAAYLGAAVTLIHLDPVPHIDVWYVLQGAADALAHGENAYTRTWVGSPGVKDAFTYLPWMGVLLAPGRWLAGDVRWALVAVTVLGAVAIRRSGRGRAAAAAAALLLLLPGTATQVEQAWTEPLLLACLAGAVLALQRGRTVAAVVLLALGLASKQHLALLVPVLAAWPRLGPRRTAAACGLAGLLILPWFLADPGAIWHDTVSLLVTFPPLRFADTLYIAALNDLGWSPPFWLTGAVVVSTVVAVAWVVHRRNPGAGELLRWCALVLLMANLVNKQAFYNQYWLVLALVAASWAISEPDQAAEPRGTAATEAAPLSPPAAPPADAVT